MIQESALESRAREVLRRAHRSGPGEAMDRASLILRQSLDEPVSLDRRARVFELGAIGVVELIPMAVPLRNHIDTIGAKGARAGSQPVR